MLDRKSIIDAVARKHGIILSDDDPILSFLCVHDVILDEYRERFEHADKSRQIQLERMLDRVSSKTVRTLTAAVGKERERFLRELQSVLDVERKPRRAEGKVMSIILWSIIVSSVLLAAYLLFFIIL